MSLESTVSLHWLAIDGIQPTIPQNPTPAVKEPLWKANANTNKVVPLVKHVLSKELQLYFEKVRSTLLEGTATAIDAVLEQLKIDTGIHQLVPYFVQFIPDQVMHHLRDLDMLVVLMRMTRSLLTNDSILIEPYLHQLMPCILTCMVGKRLCNSPEENHWALRDYAAAIIKHICSRFGHAYKSLQPRVTKTLIQALLDEKKPLTTHYGAIKGLSVFGPQVVEELLLPHLKSYMSRLEPDLESNSTAKVEEAKRVKSALLECIGGFIYAMTSGRTDGDKTGEYAELYSLFGDSLLPFINMRQ